MEFTGYFPEKKLYVWKPLLEMCYQNETKITGINYVLLAIVHTMLCVIDPRVLLCGLPK